MLKLKETGLESDELDAKARLCGIGYLQYNEIPEGYVTYDPCMG